MSITELDKPIWESLSGTHQHLAIGTDLAKRYPPDISPIAALKENTEEALQELASVVDVGETILMIGMPEIKNAQWEILHQMIAFQMICTETISVPKHDLDIQRLTAKDAPDMMALVELTKPGPFEERTIELGAYLGIRQDNQLLAMAGSRMCTPNYREISGVCTHPDYRGNGYGSLLTKILAHQFQQDDLISFLHVESANLGAKRLYEKLGFEVHQELEAAVMRRLAD